MQHQDRDGLSGMTKHEDEFEQICGRIPKIQALHAEALALAPCLGGDPDRIKEAWRGKDGMQARIAEAVGGIEDPGESNRAYDVACEAIWRVLNVG